MVVPFLLTLLCLFVLAVMSMSVLSSLRAYVGGEGLWSKGQKEAVHHLSRYAVSRDPAEFEQYLAAIAVPLGDRKARVELDKARPDFALARQGFLEGRNDEADIDGMIHLFRRFRRLESIERAIAIWAAADLHIAKLAALADRLRDEVESAAPRPATIDEIVAGIDREADLLAPLEDAFSYTLGQASREVGRSLTILLAVATAILTAVVAWFARSVLQEREQHQRALHESEERYHSFFQNSIDAVILGTPDGIIEAVNPAACFAFGCNQDELKESGSSAGGGDTFDSLKIALREGSRTGRYRGNLPFRRADGRVFIGEVSSSRFAAPSGQHRTSVVIRDISARIRAEEEIRRLNSSLELRVAARTTDLEAANRDLRLFNSELESFCYSVSHDLRLPLRSMSGFSELLITDYGDALDDRGKDYLHRVQDACRRMGRLIDDLLSLVRYTRQPLVHQQIDIGAIAMEIVEQLRLEHPDQQVAVRVSPDLLSMAQGDPSLVRVMLRCLLKNAWKFSSQSSEPRVEFGSRRDGAESVYFVRDNGCGFDMAFADKLFRVFNRLHAADEFEGTGIGLAIVQRVVLRHGGRVWAESAPQCGATFFFTLAEVADTDLTAAGA